MSNFTPQPQGGASPLASSLYRRTLTQNWFQLETKEEPVPKESESPSDSSSPIPIPLQGARI